MGQVQQFSTQFRNGYTPESVVTYNNAFSYIWFKHYFISEIFHIYMYNRHTTKDKDLIVSSWLIYIISWNVHYL